MQIDTERYLNDDTFSIKAKYLIIVVVAIMLLLYGFAGAVHVSPGEAAVLVQNLGDDDSRGMKDEPLPLGWSWVEPIKYDVFIYDAKVKQFTVSGIKAGTADGQPISVDISFDVSLDYQKVSLLHQQIGQSYYDQIVYPSIRAAVRNATATQPSDAIYTGTGRAGVQAMITGILKGKLDKYGIYAIANLRDVTFENQDFVQTIEAKAKAAQAVEIARNRAAQAEQDAIKVANKAEGEKQKSIKEAEASAETMRLEGIGERQKKEQQAKGILAIAKARAEGTRLQVNAYGSGRTYASVKWAENLGPNVKVWGVPTGAPGTSSLMDINGIIQGAFKGAVK